MGDIPSSRRVDFAAKLLGALAFTSLAFSVGAVPVDGERLWITVGADAFELLQNDPEVRLDGEELQLHGEIEQVVMTEIRSSDALRISELIHHHFNRCGGFMVHRSRSDAQAALRGPAVRRGDIEYQLDQEFWVQLLQGDLEEARIVNVMESLSTDFPNRYYSLPSGRAAAEWIRDLWVGYAEGRPDVTVELVEHSWTQPSVVMTLEGISSPEETVVLGGHLDSIVGGADPDNPTFSAPGADDNASGIATLSEVARVLLASDFRPGRTVRFMGYAAEEVGLLGSADIAGAYRDAEAEVVGVLQLDMTAWNGSLEDIALLSDYTDSSLTSFVGTLIDTYQPGLSRVSSACGYGCSDHASWHREGYPTAMAHEARVAQNNPSIHSTGDTLETLGYSAAHAVKFARLGLAFAIEVSTNAEPILVETFETGTLEAWEVVP